MARVTPRTALLVVVVALCVVATSLGPAGAGTDPGDLDPALDNADPASVTGCADTTSPAGSLVTRRLPEGPRRADGSLAFRSGICLYLPPGYDADAGTQLRYPVIYLLHGGSGWQHDWVTQGAVQQVMDEAYGEDPRNAAIVIMPDGTNDAVWRDQPSGQLLLETYLFDYVIPYVDARFRTIADRSGRAISGLSQGGAGTSRFASLRPDMFVAAAPMSAAYPYPTNLTTPATHPVRDVANDPMEIMDNLDPVELAVIYGRSCGSVEAPTNCAQYAPVYAFEHVCCNNDAYAAKLAIVRQTPWTYHAVEGGHAWFYWTRWLRDPIGPFLREHLADPMPADAPQPVSAPPASFRYRSIKPAFSIFGYEVEVSGRPAAEFLALRDVGVDGLTVEGSGSVSVVTAPRYAPGAAYEVLGTGGPAAEVVADPSGRLAFTVDLGPGHTADQYTREAWLAEAAAAGGYRVTRTVSIVAS
jgi:S-formylglutathione hydrolase FrmB